MIYAKRNRKYSFSRIGIGGIFKIIFEVVKYCNPYPFKIHLEVAIYHIKWNTSDSLLYLRKLHICFSLDTAFNCNFSTDDSCRNVFVLFEIKGNYVDLQFCDA